ncbi:HNH endonuclease [bacterium]|nr:HNH endonuclease [bacterium]
MEVLLLNSDFTPLNVCSLRRAIGLLFVGKADVLHYDGTYIRTPQGAIRVPSVIRLKYHIKRPVPELKLTRKNILARDNYTCQYCGQKGGELTIDHVIPKKLGGKTDWDNLVCCCKRCNAKKKDKTPQQAGMHLLRQPKRPSYIPFISLTKYRHCLEREDWRPYLPPLSD